MMALAATVFMAVGCGSGDSGNTAGNTASTTPAAGGGSTPAAGGDQKPVEVAFITNNTSDFWTYAQAGTEKAKAELPGVTVDFMKPSEGTAAEQTTIINDMLSKGVQGMAISVKDPANQKQLLNDAAKKTLVVTQDSDAGDSDRACYIGTDNIAAGKMLGEQLKAALPNGGKVELFVGAADAQNVIDRKKGLEDAIKGTKIQILGMLTDETDRAKAKTNVADTLVKVPDIAGLVGLWSYNGPAILNAVKEANKVGKVQIVCTDEEAETVQGVKDGAIFATIVQQPFEFGYQSVKVMVSSIRGDKSAIPANKQILIPTQAITKANVEDFAKKLDEMKAAKK